MRHLAARVLTGLLLFGGSLASSDPAWAARPAPPLLVYGPGAAEPALEDRAVATYNLQSATRRAAPRVRSAEAVLAGLDDIEFTGLDQFAACPGSPVSAVVFDEALAEALGYVRYGQTEAARLQLTRLDSMLPCLGEVLAREDLAQISFLQGVGLAFAGDEDAAREAFREALVVRPEMDWNPEFSPAAESLFHDAIQLALRSSSAELEVEPAVGATAQLWIDGQAMAPGGGLVTLAEGRHLLQWSRADGGFETRVVQLRGGQRVSAFGRDDVARAMMDGQGGPECVARAAGTLRGLAAEVGVDTVHLVELGDSDLLYRYDVASERWSLADMGSMMRRVRIQQKRTIGQTSMIVGGALLLSGALVGVSGVRDVEELLQPDDERQTVGSYTDDNNEYHKAQDRARIGLALAGTGTAAIAIGIPLAASGRSQSPAGEPQVVAPELGVGPTGVSLQGRFR